MREIPIDFTEYNCFTRVVTSLTVQYYCLSSSCFEYHYEGLHLTTLRQFYTRRNISGMSGRNRFLLLLHMRKTFVYGHFPEMSILLKVEIISPFPLRKNVAFFLNKSFFEYSFKQSESL